MTDQWRDTAGLCRDCDAPVAARDDVCPVCGSPRLVKAAGLFDLAIAHVDCDAFFANIEKRDDPRLRDRPVLVGANSRRGVVAAACYIARTYGARSAMPMTRARRLCPDAVVIAPDKDKYARDGRRIRAIMRRFTPLVEPLSIDEAFLDLSGTERLHGAPPAVVLARLARAVEAETGLTISIGLSVNKFLAKMASDLDKPRGYAVIARQDVMAFLDGLRVSDLWGVGPATARALAREGVVSVPQLRARKRDWLIARFGRLGEHLYQLARGHDPRAVQPHHQARSISAETTFAQDIRALPELEAHLWKMARKVMRRALEKELAGDTVTLKLKDADFRQRTLSAHLDEPTLLAGRIFAAARALLRKAHDGAPCRLIGVGISGLAPAPPDMLALSLDARAAKAAKAELTAEDLRRRFGDDAVDFGIGLTGNRRKS